MTNRECVFFKEKRVWVTLLSTSVLWNMLGRWISFKKTPQQIEMQQQEGTRCESGVFFIGSFSQCIPALKAHKTCLSKPRATRVCRQLVQESWYLIMSLSIKSRLFCGRREELQGGKKI